MPSPNCFYRFRPAVLLIIVGSLIGCTIPGMRLNATAQGNDEPYFSAVEPDAQNVDIFPINLDTIKRLEDEASIPATVQQVQAEVRSFTPEEYRVGRQDILRVTVWDHPELNNPSGTTSADPASNGRIVSNDGTIFYPYVGTVAVAGKTPHEIQLYLRKALEKVIKDPQVEVVIQTYHSRRVLISGEVKLPGVQFIGEFPLRVSEAVAAAGGATPDADLTKVTLTRGVQVRTVNVYQELSRGDASEDITLRDGDLISVPEGRPRKVFVMGEIVKQGSLPFPPGKYSLTDALGDCGGVLQVSSNPAQIYVIRSVNNRPTIYHLNARNPDALIVADDFDLRPRDVIYVEAAEVSRIGRVISQILPAATALATGRTIAQ